MLDKRFHECRIKFDIGAYLLLLFSRAQRILFDAPGAAINFDLMTPNMLDTHNTPYDFDSIMSYNPYTWAADSSRPVMVPKPGKADGVFQIGQRLWLSDMDVLRIQGLYGCQRGKKLLGIHSSTVYQ